MMVANQLNFGLLQIKKQLNFSMLMKMELNIKSKALKNGIKEVFKKQEKALVHMSIYKNH